MIPPPGASCALDRERVLKYPDLAHRLTQPPLGYARPAQWTGYIPPAFYGQQINTCPRRDALVDIVQEAYRREVDGRTPPDQTTPHEQDPNA